MYSTGDICNRLDTGAAGSKKTFTDPTSGPGSTGCSLNDIMDKAPAKDNVNGAQPSDVVAGKKYWGLTDGHWGLQTGQGDSNLVPSNIREGVTIFGVVGTAKLAAPSSPSDRYVDNGNGTVTDTWSSLIWLKNAKCLGHHNWEGAMQIAANLANGQCGLSDGSIVGMWRLPTKLEWGVMIDKNYSNPALSNAAGTSQWTEGDAFTGVQSSIYWSSTANGTSSAWVVRLDNGDVFSHDQANTGDVWAVRGGQ
ncbi:protein containing DUF1566 [Candidatus Thiomargarita nelsonii]|uniref:Protein containing DUF1566 n=1 Tax=Candidatus Thiomargarita nelsonii TaxID=1003181 RepID=A0A0A6P262_9GAMM|nr:protein containing DUF1566 [Candidatus Thiomargarita nelsonii]